MELILIGPLLFSRYFLSKITDGCKPELCLYSGCFIYCERCYISSDGYTSGFFITIKMFLCDPLAWGYVPQSTGFTRPIQRLNTFHDNPLSHGKQHIIAKVFMSPATESLLNQNLTFRIPEVES